MSLPPLKNPFKAALAAGKPQLGIWCSIPSPTVAEVLGQSAFDWVLFDAEHTPVELSGLVPMMQAAASGKAHTAARPPWNDPVLIKRVLDSGAQTILLPFVQTPDEAAQAVAATRYPQGGIRGVAGATRAGRYGRDKQYLHRASDDICVLVQVETGEALARIDSIAATDGVDGVFIGPSDLSASLGHIGNPGHPEVQDAIKEAALKIRAAGKAPGILATNAADARKYLDWGFLFVACSLDLILLVNAVDRLHAEVTA